MKILFVCLGNICRSPIAHAIAQHMYPDWKIDSCGLSAYHEGEDMDYRSKQVLENHNMYHPVISKPITKVNTDEFDLILCMDFSNLVRLDNMGIKAKYITFLTDKSEVKDPYHDPIKGFEKTYQKIYSAVKELKNYSLQM